MKKVPPMFTKVVSTPDHIGFQVIESSGVEVTFSRRAKKAPWHISVWGDDDIGYSIDIADFDEARSLYNSVRDGITRKQLEAMGFEQC